MESFVEKVNTIVSQAFEFIKEKTLKEGKIVIIRLHEEGNEEGGIIEEDDDFFYEAPFVGHYGKYGSYSEYAILSLEAEDGDVIVHTRGRGEVDEDRKFKIEQVEQVQILHLADLIQ